MDRKPRLALMTRHGRRVALLGAAIGLPAGTLSAQSPVSLPPVADQTTADDPDVADNDQLDRAGHIASQPVRDVGIGKTKIPPVLQEAFDAPYAVPKRQDCRWLNYELARLDQVLGPDFDVTKAKEDKVEQIAFAGGEMIVNSVIPFRGLVREISGAAPADRRMKAAVNAGLARRGYVRGLAQVKSCAPTRYAETGKSGERP